MNVFVDRMEAKGAKRQPGSYVSISRFGPKALANVLFVVALAAAPIRAQYVINTVAGGAPQSTPVPALSASLGAPQGVAVDSNGNVYFSSLNSVYKIDAAGTLTLVAGNSRPGYSGDGGPAVNAQLYAPTGLAVDSSGNVYIADTLNHAVRMVASDGTITTVAGNGFPGFAGDGAAASASEIDHPTAVAVDNSGNLYIADTYNNRMRKVSNGVISTFAGTGFAGFSTDGTAASAAQLAQPNGIAVDNSSGNVHFVDMGNNRVRTVDSAGNLSTVAGNGTGGYSGDGGKSYSAALSPFAIALDHSGNLYIADLRDARIRKVSTGGVITTFAGNGTLGDTGDGGQAGSAQIAPYGVATDAGGNVYFVDPYSNRVRKVSTSGVITTIAGNGKVAYSGDGGPGTAAQLISPASVAASSDGNVYIADTGNNVIRRLAGDGGITTIAGTGAYGYGGDGAAASSALLASPAGLAVDGAGNIYVADTGNSRVREITADGNISTVAGSGLAGYAGDNNPALAASLNTPMGLAVDRSRNLYIADTNNNAIRMVNPAGVITTVAGSGIAGYSGDKGAAASAQLNHPTALAVDQKGNLYIADSFNNAIRKVAGGIITTVAGGAGFGDLGDGGPAAAALLAQPSGVAVDGSGNLFISDSYNNVIRKIGADGTISLIAGQPQPGYSGDGGPALGAQLQLPLGLTVDGAGNIYIADNANQAIRQLSLLQSAVVSVNAVVNAASNLAGPIALGEMVVLYGSGMGGQQITLSNGGAPTNLAGTQVQFNGVPAGLIYSWTSQVAAIVPDGVTGPVNIQVSYNGQNSNTLQATTAASAPGLFTVDSSGSGQARATNSDGGSNDASHPAALGSFITLIGTGAEQLTAGTVSVSIGGATADLDLASSGLSGPGTFQIRARVPASLGASSAIPVVVTIGTASSQPGVTIAAQ